MGASNARTARGIGFATSHAFPDGTPDDRRALEVLRADGIDALPVVWDDPSVRWDRFAMVVVRSTWDYHRKISAFTAWVERVSEIARLWNSAGLVRWNLHKGYLLDLDRRGTSIVPTELVRRDSGESLEDIALRRGWDELVIKPAIGADAAGLVRIPAAARRQGESHLQGLLQTGDALVQPFLSQIPTLGERSLIFFDGNYSHTIGYPFVLSGRPREPELLPADPPEISRARSILGRLDEVPLYARLDFLPGADGTWLLGELELIEPELFLRADPESPARFASAIRSRL